MLWICLEEDVCLLYIVLMHGEKESLSGQRLFKDHSWRIIVESRGPKTLKKLSNSPYITTCCSGGFQEKFSSLVQKQSPAYSVIRHDWNFKWDWLLWSDETKKMSFLAANTQDGFGEHGDKKYPMCTINILLIFDVVGLYFCWRSWTSCLDT